MRYEDLLKLIDKYGAEATFKDVIEAERGVNNNE